MTQPWWAWFWWGFLAATVAWGGAWWMDRRRMLAALRELRAIAEARNELYARIRDVVERAVSAERGETIFRRAGRGAAPGGPGGWSGDGVAEPRA